MRLFLLFVWLLNPFGITLALGEFECVSHVHYTWEVSETGAASQDKDDAEKSDKGKEVKSEKSAKSFEVLSVTRRIRAVTEDEAKTKLQTALDKDKRDAMQECQSVHENLSGCIAAKFLAMGNVLRQLDFNARKELENSISEDCRSSTGRCLKSDASPAECQSLEPKKEEEQKKGEDDPKK